MIARLFLWLSLAVLFPAPAYAQEAGAPAPLTLEPCRLPGLDEDLACGVHHVFENREAGEGRRLPLKVVRIPPKVPGDEARPPVFVIVGGPGQTATEFAPALANSWERQHNAVILVDQRGTGDGHRLDCALPGSDEDPTGYFSPMFDEGLHAACRRELETRADLTRYTTTIAAADLDEVRRALGHETIFLSGASYGTRVMLSYLRDYGGHVAGGVMNSPAPLSLRNPLHHARAAQDAFDGLVRECFAQEPCRQAFPDLPAYPAIVADRLRQAPARVRLEPPVARAPVTVELGPESFAEAVRVLLYSGPSAGMLPLLLQRAVEGDLTPFASVGLQMNRALRSSLRMGMLNSVICAEDMTRIRPEDIERETAGTFLGADRARRQMNICADWPRGAIPADHFTPFRSDTPMLVITGDLDPATPPAGAREITGYFSDSLHLEVPGGHSPMNDCIAAIASQFTGGARIADLETGCMTDLSRAPFQLPEA